ncbi:MAG: hypothetical protein R3F62_26525 [Planctomycetota bacterium]
MSTAAPQPDVPNPGFSVVPPPAERPGFDPSESPLVRGGAPGAPEPAFAGSTLLGLTAPTAARKRRVIYRVRREGWLARRSAARSRFREIDRGRDPLIPRVLAGLQARRRGILDRSKSQAVRPRIELRGLLRGN